MAPRLRRCSTASFLLLITGPLLFLVFLEPDLGTMGVLTVTAFTMFFVAGGSLWQLALVVPAATAALAYLVSNSAYQMARVQAFLNPWADPQGIGFHTVQGLLALGTGGVLGIGLGESRQPGQLHLPAAQTDFVHAVLAQELGFIGGALVIGFYLLFAYRGIRIALRAPDTFGALLATGITAWLTLPGVHQHRRGRGPAADHRHHAAVRLAGRLVLLVSLAAVGILLSISRRRYPRESGMKRILIAAGGTGGHVYPAGRRSVPARAGA